MMYTCCDGYIILIPNLTYNCTVILGRIIPQILNYQVSPDINIDKTYSQCYKVIPQSMLNLALVTGFSSLAYIIILSYNITPHINKPDTLSQALLVIYTVKYFLFSFFHNYEYVKCKGV
jgi:hypothetical protein